MPPDTIRLSQAARDQLITLKRRTGITHWNTLCRWGLCRSLAEATEPPAVHHPADSSVEMGWRTFGGANADVFWALLVQRHVEQGLSVDEETLQRSFRLHLHRGVSYLSGDLAVRDIGGLLGLAGDLGIAG